MKSIEPRVERYRLRDGYGSIGLKGDDFDCAIYFKGKPYALNWCAPMGTVFGYLVRTGVEGFQVDLQQIRTIVQSKPDEHEPLHSQFAPLLQLFEPGNYVLTYYDALKWIDAGYKADDLVGYYPESYVLATTQPKNSLDRSTVKEYLEKIRNGARPTVITASPEDGLCEFVIDGHHKLEAYRLAKKWPRVLHIGKEHSMLGLEEGLQILDNTPYLQLYKQVKVRHT